jgi:hypothetical protein
MSIYGNTILAPAGTDTSSWCWGPVLKLGNLKKAKICLK